MDDTQEMQEIINAFKANPTELLSQVPEEQQINVLKRLMEIAQQTGDEELAALVNQVMQEAQPKLKCGGKVRAKMKKAACGCKVKSDKCGAKVEADKCGGKTKKVKKGENGLVTKKPTSFETGYTKTYEKVGYGKKGCPCMLKKVGGKLIEVDGCTGLPIHRDGGFIDYFKPGGKSKQNAAGRAYSKAVYNTINATKNMAKETKKPYRYTVSPASPSARIGLFSDELKSLAARRQWLADNMDYMLASGWDEDRINNYNGDYRDNIELARLINDRFKWKAPEEQEVMLVEPGMQKSFTSPRLIAVPTQSAQEIAVALEPEILAMREQRLRRGGFINYLNN